MTQANAPQKGERLTSRQRRIEDQRRKIEDLRRQQRRQRLVGGGLALLAALVVIAAVVFLIPRPAAAQGRQVAIEGNRNHVPQGTDIPYRNRPPSSGDHYDQTAGYGVSTREVPTGNWVHNLEHGAVVVLYRPDLCDATCQAQLAEVYTSAPASQVFPGTRKMIVAPYTDMDHPIAALAWGWEDDLDVTNPVDKDRLLAFYRAHLDRGPEQAP